MSEDTRERILEACDRLILSIGLSRVTTKEIARETGLSEGALYRHFDRKEDVFLSVFEKQVIGLSKTLNAYDAGSGEVKDNLQAICIAILHYYERLIPLTASFFADTDLLSRFRELLNRLGSPERLHQRVAHYIEEEKQFGRVVKDILAISTAASLLGPAFQYAFLRQLIGKDPFGLSDTQFVEGLIDVVVPRILSFKEQEQ